LAVATGVKKGDKRTITIKVYSDSELAKRQFALKLAAAIGRVYKRG